MLLAIWQCYSYMYMTCIYLFIYICELPKMPNLLNWCSREYPSVCDDIINHVLIIWYDPHPRNAHTKCKYESSTLLNLVNSMALETGEWTDTQWIKFMYQCNTIPLTRIGDVQLWQILTLISMKELTFRIYIALRWIKGPTPHAMFLSHGKNFCTKHATYI